MTIIDRLNLSMKDFKRDEIIQIIHSQSKLNDEFLLQVMNLILIRLVE